MTVKTEEIKKEVTETVTKYVAKDGTEFNSDVQCLGYEETVKCVFGERLKGVKVPIKKDGMFEKGLDCLLDDGMARSDYYKIVFKTEDDIKNFIGYAVVNNTAQASDKYNTYRLSFNELKVGVTYLYVEIPDCDYSFITSYEKIMSSLKSGWDFLMEEEKKEEEKKGE